MAIKFPVGVVLILYVGIVAIAIPTSLHYSLYQKFNFIQIAMSFFLGLNLLICMWEIGLGLNINNIKKELEYLQNKYKKDQFQSVADFFVHSLTIQEIFTLKTWNRVWSTYSLYDPSYSNQESFGFFIDVGNGWVTLLPTVLSWVTMTYDFGIPARIVGIISIMIFYQELYGTCIYFLSFFFNNRQKGRTITEVSLFIGLSNGIWFFLPLLGIYGSLYLIYDESYAIYR